MSKPTLKMTHGAIGEAMCCYTDGSYKDADIALTEYENLIRAEAIQKFAEWLEDNSYLNWVGEGNDVNSMSAEEALAEYEKEQKNNMDNDSIIETYLRDWCYSEVEEALNVARADERRKALDEVYVIALNESHDTLIEWLQNNIVD